MAEIEGVLMAVDRERLAASRAAQGLPPKVTDPGALHRLAVLFSPGAAQMRSTPTVRTPRPALEREEAHA